MNGKFELSNSLKLASILKRQFFELKILNINVSDKQTKQFNKKDKKILVHQFICANENKDFLYSLS